MSDIVEPEKSEPQSSNAQPEASEKSPEMTSEQLRAHLQKLRDEAEANWKRKAEAETRAAFDHVVSTANRMIKIFSELPCQGAVSKIPECSEDFAAQCEQRHVPSCPREIFAYDVAVELRNLEERLVMSGIPRALHRSAMQPEKTHAVQLVDEWLPGKGTLLVLSGGVGVGKSVAAAYAIRRTPGRWLNASELGRLTGYQHEDRLRELRNSRLLVVDDLGSDDSKGIEELLLRRFDDGLRTIATTNLNTKSFKAAYTERLIDRIRGSKGFELVGGESMRRPR